MDRPTDPTQPLADVLGSHVTQYRLAARQQENQARRLLAQNPPDYSVAATACHRALQFQRQAEALEALAKDAQLW
jgi:hypothetical protein